MTKNSELIVDDNGVEILVSYEYEKEPAYEAEPGNPNTYVSEMVYTELNTVEVIIKGVGIDILPVLTERQKEHIVSLLNYEA